MFKEKINKQFGFTLIELLVVISIIGFLATASMVVFNSVRIKARDTRRKADLTQIRKALDLYYDANSAYPSSSGAWRSACPSYGGYPTSGATGYIPNLAPTHIGKLPIDPSPCSNGNGYLYYSDTVNYKLLSHVSPESYPSAGQPFYDPFRPTWAWMLCSANTTVCNTW
ncbi:hypothetical protein A3H09_02710 [Candidatus Falkowbacteria bacterium RIFCSPLOWO2_12_FULL_45_13]|uniref:Type II secretion system protein GspG C-terminal domain-containing protein n=1 Tax=Candidatus Falkowbacteria bacterium RIFCSPLOWO2_12_FULL_45_13 TaxID=1797991 RepID=A0A1F5SUH5_9BACT|nr:MAG: hypothetical protein A3H09_02710 [Candidatus Falkowbacteria bacterium RIFCSPLOWO2_12_FULL_45_13]